MSTSETLQSVGRSKNACMESLRSRAVPQNAHAFELWDTVNCLRGSFFLDKYAFTVFSQTSWAPPAPTWTLKNKGIYSRATYPPSCKPPPTTFAHFPAKPPRAAYTSEYGIIRYVIQKYSPLTPPSHRFCQTPQTLGLSVSAPVLNFAAASRLAQGYAAWNIEKVYMYEKHQRTCTRSCKPPACFMTKSGLHERVC